MAIVAPERFSYTLLAFIVIKMKLHRRSNPVAKVRKKSASLEHFEALKNLRKPFDSALHRYYQIHRLKQMRAIEKILNDRAGIQMKILILAALPQEYSPLKKLLPHWRILDRKPLKKFTFELPGKEIILIESGMGAKSAEEALMTEIPGFVPDLLIFSGFAGGLHPNLEIGSVCFASGARETCSEDLFKFRFPKELNVFLAKNNVIPVLGISSETPDKKHALCALADGQMAVLDMETAKLAEIALQMKVPFICFRAISDCLHHDLGFDLCDITDGRGRIRLSGVISTVLRRPAAMKGFYLSWRRSRLAAKNLCGSVVAFLGLSTLRLSKWQVKSARLSKQLEL